MDKSVTRAQFMERYLRDNDISRVQLYGMDSAHKIMTFVAQLRDMLSAGRRDLCGRAGVSPAAPADPAPP